MKKTFTDLKLEDKLFFESKEIANPKKLHFNLCPLTVILFEDFWVLLLRSSLFVPSFFFFDKFTDELVSECSWRIGKVSFPNCLVCSCTKLSIFRSEKCQMCRLQNKTRNHQISWNQRFLWLPCIIELFKSHIDNIYKNNEHTVFILRLRPLQRKNSGACVL